MDRLERVVREGLDQSGFLRSTTSDEAIGHLRVALDVRITRPPGSFAWQLVDGLLLIAPSMIGLPIGWIKYQTTAQIELLDRTGSVVWKTQVNDKQNHYFAIYYGHRNVNEPYRKDLRDISLKFVRAFEQERDVLLATLMKSKNAPYSITRLRPIGYRRAAPTGVAPLPHNMKRPRPVEERLKLAVMDVHAKRKLLSGSLQEKVTDYVRVVAGSTARFIVIDKSRQEEHRKRLIRGSKKESYKDCYDNRCQIPLGMAVAADSLLRTEVKKFGKTYIVTMELVDLAREATVASSSAKCDGSEEGFAAAIDDAMERLVNNL